MKTGNNSTPYQVLQFLKPGALRIAQLPPLSLYVHIPWCVRKCPYCDFNSHALRDDAPFDAYVDALLLDLQSSLPAVWGRRIYSVFFGGGTPSLMPPEVMDRLLSGIRALLPLAADAEITLEANPGASEASRFREFRSMGINRLSIGVQSFNDRHLQVLGRVHDAAAARAAAEVAADCFDTFNLDLMYGLPQQTLAEAQADMAVAIQLQPTHISAYHLTLEPNTLFHRHPPALPDDEVCADMQQALEQQLAAAGFEHYETSAFARHGHQCRHNLNYWQFGDYLGIGAGAHGKISFPERIIREQRYKHPALYVQNCLAGSMVEESKEIAGRDLPFEFAMNALRLRQGVPLDYFADRTGLSVRQLQAPLAQARARGLLSNDADHLVATPLGQRFLNDLLVLFLPA